MSPQQRPPVVAATAIRERGDTWSLAIQCPYCPKQHRHGGGNGVKPQINGTCVPHCQDVTYRQRPMFDARVTRWLPHYELAPADAPVDWDAERSYASALLEEAEMALAEQEQATEWTRTAQGRIVNAQIREALGMVEEAQARKQGRNTAYLAAWQAKQEGRA